jgi:hypothetical protein
MRSSIMLLPLLLGGCPLLDVEADVQEACVTRTGVQIAANAPTSDQSIVVDHLDGLADLAKQGFHLTLVHGQVRATSGISDFSFVTSAAVSLASGDPSSTLATLDALACDSRGSADAILDVTPSSTADVAPYIESGSLILNVDLAGAAPAVDWTMDVEVCAHGSASYEANL